MSRRPVLLSAGDPDPGENVRVLLVSDFVPPVYGGLEIHVLVLAGELARLGHEVVVATLTPEPEPAPDGVRVVTIDAIASTVLPHSDPDRPFHPPLPDPRARRQLGALVERFDPDVIHGHSWLAVSVPGRFRDRMVWTAHDYGLICQVRTLLRPDGSRCAGPHGSPCIRCGTPSLGMATSALLATGTAVGRRLVRPAALVTVNSTVKATLEAYLGRDDIHVLPLFPLADPEVDPAGVAFPPRPYVMFAGDPGDHKGVPDLLRIWSRPQPADLLLAVTRPVRQPLPAGVVSQQLTRPQVVAAWRSASVAVIPSRWHEPGPTVAVEAMAAGLPIVAYAMGGLREYVEDGVTGFLVEVGDEEALQERLQRLSHDDRLRASMAAAARRRSERYRPQVIVAELVQIYEQVRQGRRSAGGRAGSTPNRHSG